MKTVCPDMPGHHSEARLCDACDAPLRGRQQRWCSQDCSDLYWSNHWRRTARVAALARAGVRFVRRRRGWVAVSWRCAHCGCSTRAPEVNHRRPALRTHNHESCSHHQENLEVLCRDCHLTETRRQHAAGELRRAA